MSIRNAFLCSGVNFKKWAVDVKIYTLFSLIGVFNLWQFSGIYEYGRMVGFGVSPWVFPHLFVTPVIMPVYGCFTILFFCDAPFIDRHMPFLTIRTGRIAWVVGQLVYIFFASFVYTLINFVISIVIFFPYIDFTSEWGRVVMTLARNPASAYDKGIELTALIDGSIVTYFSAIEATLISLGLFFLVTLFMGIVIFSLNLITGKMWGIIIAGILVFISYFSIYVGRLTVGLRVYYFSPLSWCSLRYIDWYGSGESPSFRYAIVFLLGMSLFLSILSVLFFSKKDINLAQGVE